MPTHPSHHDPGNGPAGTTRTRLPEGGYATPRRPPARASRTLVTVVGIVVLLIAALAFATRGSSSGGTGTSASGPGTSTGGASAPSAAPTTPTGTAPVTTTTSGIPTGYPHTPQGAQSAAANYAVALGGDGMFTTPTRHRIVSAIAAPSAVTNLQSTYDSDYSAAFLSHVGLNADGTAPSGQTFVSRTIPAGSKIVSAGTGGTKVAVWCMGLSGLAGTASTKPVASDWFTVTLTLSWQASDWKVVDVSQSSGPTPVTGDDRVSDSDQIAGAVQGYGGFTYAR